MLKYGKICEVDYIAGWARVNFDEIDIVSGWLSLPTSSTYTDKEFIPLPINTQVAVLMHPDGEQGEIIKAVWSKEDTVPSWANENTRGIEYSNGDKFIHNNKSGIFEFNDGKNGGIPITPNIIKRLNIIEESINSLKNAFYKWVVVPSDGGAALKVVSQTWASETLTKSEDSDIENSKITQ